MPLNSDPPPPDAAERHRRTQAALKNLRQSIESASASFRNFLESEPLLKPVELDLSWPIKNTDELWPSRLQLPCPVCSTEETTTWMRAWTGVQRPTFTCALCNKNSISFWIEIEITARENVADEDSVTLVHGKPELTKGYSGIKRCKLIKVGQWPAWSPRISNRLLKNLGSNARLFKRGIACLQEGLGLGAAAYFRRVIEEEVNALLDLVERAAKLDGDQAALDNLADARRSQAAADRLQIAVQKVPLSLRPGNSNPLAVLYGALSGAVHQESEEQALNTAKGLMKTFLFLFEELKERMTAAEAYATELQQARDRTAAAKSSASMPPKT